MPVLLREVNCEMIIEANKARKFLLEETVMWKLFTYIQNKPEAAGFYLLSLVHLEGPF